LAIYSGANWSRRKPRRSNNNAASRRLPDVSDEQVTTMADAVAGVRDGTTVLVAGFGAVGVADNLLDALHAQAPARAIMASPG
jgi:Coenzyme A transferase